MFSPKIFPIFFILFLFSTCAIAQEAYLNFSDQDSVLRGTVGGIPFIKSDVAALLGKNYSVVCHRAGSGISSTSPQGAAIWTWKFKGGSLIRTRQTLGDEQQITFDFAYDKGIDGNTVQICLYLTRVSMDFKDNSIPFGKITEPITLHTFAGDVILDPAGSLNGNWYLEDFRKADWAGNMFRLTFNGPYSPENGATGRAVLTFKPIPASSPAFVQLPLDEKISRSFSDDESGLGWTGQGHANDLSSMPARQLVCAGVPFNITGRGIVLRGKNTPNLPAESGVMKFSAPVQTPLLYFLHTAAWACKYNTLVAEYELHYTDGTVTTIPVQYGREINDWWHAQQVLNARVGWSGRNGGNHIIGIYMMRSKNPYPEKSLAAINFKSADSLSTPALLAVTAVKANDGNQAILDALDTAFSKNIPPSLNTNGWKPCVISWDGGIAPGSALDLSFLNHKPAGQYGFLKRVGGSFEFEKKPGESVRFWGTNFAIEGPFPDKKLSPGIAQTLAAQGVNLVRLHLYAARPYLLQLRDGLNPEMLDKMLFLIAELEKNGIYIYMDYNDGLCYDQLLKRPSTYNPEEHLKFCSIFDPELKKATKRFAELLFGVVNPYTGKKLAEDPGIAMFEIMNENSMLQNWLDIGTQCHGSYRELLQQLWHDYLKSQNEPLRPIPPNFDVDPTARRFASSIDQTYFAEMKAHLQSLGIKSPICGTNYMFNNGSLVSQAQMDFFGDHMYWAHPAFSFGLPSTYSSGGAAERPVWEKVVETLGRSSLANYPAVHSEWNYCFPNPKRCEGIPTAAAYAAYQDWDAMIFYGATGSCDEGRWNRFISNPAIMVHSQQTDPATWGLSQFGAMMFRRGDVASAKRILQVKVANSDIYNRVMPLQNMPFLPALGRYEITFGETANWLGEIAKTSKTPSETYRDVCRQLGETDSNAERIVSDTKQIRRYSAPALLFVDTPRTQSVSGRLCDIHKSGDSLSGLKVDTTMEWGSVNATALDGLALPQSKRILLAAVGDAANTGENLEGGYVVNIGKAPVLIEPFKAVLSLSSTLSKAKLYAINSATGARITELPLTHNNGVYSFLLDGQQGTIYFEFVAE